MFEKDKDYRFSFNKYREACAKENILMGEWARLVNGAKVIVSKDQTQGLIHGDIVQKGQVVNLNGMILEMPGNRERVCYMMNEEWCEEV
jgi:hypothetical protein